MFLPAVKRYTSVRNGMEVNDFERTIKDLRKIQAGCQVTEHLWKKKEHLPDVASVSRADGQPKRRSTMQILAFNL